MRRVLRWLVLALAFVAAVFAVAGAAALAGVPQP